MTDRSLTSKEQAEQLRRHASYIEGMFPQTAWTMRQIADGLEGPAPETEPELPESLRDPVKNLERGRELLAAMPCWCPYCNQPHGVNQTPATDAALAAGSAQETSVPRDWVIVCGDSWYGDNGKFVKSEWEARGFSSCADAQEFAKGMRCPWSVRERTQYKRPSLSEKASAPLCGVTSLLDTKCDLPANHGGRHRFSISGPTE